MVATYKDEIKLLQKGDHQVFEKIFKRYYNALFFFAVHYVKYESDAENLVQETFLSLWENRKTIQGASEYSLKAWLYNTIKNKCLNFLEKEASKKKYSEYLQKKFLLDIYVLKDFDIDEVVFDELTGLLNKAIESLPAQSRAVFEMNRLKGMKNKEIAEELGISVKAVEANMTRALKLLRTHLKDYLTLILLFRIF
ncbi:MAG: RNA polymerase sigma-70 factor [Chlorobi bacterium]|nr:RNA polymerase sigma-70 factor [Chlorobiota bacterium]